MKQWLQQRYNWINNQLASVSPCADPELPSLVISKIHYHPVSTNGYGEKNLEFIGITNADTVAIDLTGVYLRELGLSYCFPAGSSIAAGEELYLVSDSTAFHAVYGLAAFDESARHLSNHSQRLVLADAWGNIIDEVTYTDASPWPTTPDGHGPFLMLNDINSDNTLACNWITGTMLHPIHQFDTLVYIDTLHVTDTINNGNSLLILDTLFITNTTIFIDSTIFNHDITVICDTITHTDTITMNTTVHLTDINTHSSPLLNIYPVPASNFITISSDSEPLENIEIFNIAGQQVFTQRMVTTSTTINIQHFDNGIYLLRITMYDRTVVQRIIIKKSANR